MWISKNASLCRVLANRVTYMYKLWSLSVRILASCLLSMKQNFMASSTELAKLFMLSLFDRLKCSVRTIYQVP